MNRSDLILEDTKLIESVSQEEFDALHFGAIKVDRDGKILKYNLYEGRLAGRDPQEVIGRNFFTDVARCTNVQEFAGLFRAGVETGNLMATFPYRFIFPDKSVNVEITMLSSQDGETAWIFVKDKSH